MEPERSLDLAKFRLQKLEEDLARQKTEHAKALEGLAHRHRAESSDQVTALWQEVAALKETYLREKEQLRRLNDIVEHDHRKAITQYEGLVDQHMNSVRSILRRAGTVGNTAAVVEERLQAVYAQFSSPGWQVSECPERLRNGPVVK